MILTLEVSNELHAQLTLYGMGFGSSPEVIALDLIETKLDEMIKDAVEAAKPKPKRKRVRRAKSPNPALDNYSRGYAQTRAADQGTPPRPRASEHEIDIAKDRICGVLEAHAEQYPITPAMGKSVIAEACERSVGSIAKPVLRTALARLLDDGKVTRKGAGRGAKYQLVEKEKD